MPDSQLVAIQRKDILPKKFFLARSDFVIAERPEIEIMLNEFPLEQGALPYRLLSYPAVPETVAIGLRSLTATKDKPDAVGSDEILNAELVERARKKYASVTA